MLVHQVYKLVNLTEHGNQGWLFFGKFGFQEIVALESLYYLKLIIRLVTQLKPLGSLWNSFSCIFLCLWFFIVFMEIFLVFGFVTNLFCLWSLFSKLIYVEWSAWNPFFSNLVKLFLIFALKTLIFQFGAHEMSLLVMSWGN